MNQVMERYMRVKVAKGIKDEELFARVVGLYTHNKNSNEDNTIYDLFVTEFNNREAFNN